MSSEKKTPPAAVGFPIWDESREKRDEDGRDREQFPVKRKRGSVDGVNAALQQVLELVGKDGQALRQIFLLRNDP